MSPETAILFLISSPGLSPNVVEGSEGIKKVNAGIAHEKITIAGGFTDKGQGTEKSAAAST